MRLLIVDDSPVARAVLSRMLHAHPEFDVIALARNAAEALDAIARTPVDIVLLDLEMPGRGGLEILPEIVRSGKGARVLVVSSSCEEGAECALRALALGAADTLAKPGSGKFAGRFSEELADRLRRIGTVMCSAQARTATSRLDAEPEHRLGCLALGASTGGLPAVTDLLQALPESIGAPILVTQHLPAVFMPFFARQIATACGRTARVAEEGLVLRSEEVVLARGDAHLGLEKQGSRVRVRLVDAPSLSGCIPAVDVMLTAVADVYGPRGVGVVLSGMGRDGLSGARRIVERGGEVFVQDRASSSVWGMPRVVADAGLASAVLPPADLARLIALRLQAPTW